MPELLTTREVAELLRLKPGTLNSWRWSKRNNLPAIKIGGRCRYRREDVERFIEEGRVTATGAHR